MSTARPLPCRARRIARTRGFTLIEMMVSMTIGIVMVFGFAVMFLNMKTTFKAQDGLSQLQDSERLSMSVLNTTIQEAGYYPTPLTVARSDALPAYADATYGNWAAGQFVNGQAAASPEPENFQIAYATSTGDGVLNCTGGTNTTGANVTYHNIFAVDTTNKILRCKVISINAAGTGTDNGWQNLITNVTGMTVLYGVDSDGNNEIDQYLPIDSMTAALFGAVKSMRVTLTLSNPTVSGGASVTWMNTINLMNN